MEVVVIWKSFAYTVHETKEKMYDTNFAVMSINDEFLQTLVKCQNDENESVQGIRIFQQNSKELDRYLDKLKSHKVKVNYYDVEYTPNETPCMY